LKGKARRPVVGGRPRELGGGERRGEERRKIEREWYCNEQANSNNVNKVDAIWEWKAATP
jgi:hypothetical protein